MVKRNLLAFALTTLVTAIAHTIAILFEYEQRVGVPINSPGSVFALVTAFATLFVLMVGVPIFLWFEKLHWKKLWMYCVAGGLVGGLLINGWFGPSIPYAGILIGAVGAAVFWVVQRPDHSNLQLDTDAQARRST